jgi:bifunctional enzyme CysN/CysC
MICRPHNQSGHRSGHRRHGVLDDGQALEARGLPGREAHHAVGAGRGEATIHYRLDVNTLHRDEAANSLTLNEVGRVSLRLTQPLYYDSYRRNRTTGSFILASEDTNVTVGAGMILGPD